MKHKSSEPRIIGILGGAFDPPHLGHREICRYVLSQHLVDEVWVIPTFQHAFEKTMSSFSDRYRMCLFAFKDFGPERVEVLDVEKQLGGVSYMFQTVLHLKNQYPTFQFRLILGEDQKTNLSKWKNIDQLKKMAPCVWVPRGPESPIPNISSSAVRRRLQQGEAITDMVCKAVAVYITTQQLYREEAS